MKRPEDFADDAANASERGDHREAERLYLTAAARASTYSNQPTMQKNAVKWDRSAAREKRLGDLTKGSGGGSDGVVLTKPPTLLDAVTGVVASGNAGHGTSTMTKPPITGMELHQLFTGDTSGRAWYDERDQQGWNDFAKKLSAKQPSAAIGAVWAKAFADASNDTKARIARMVALSNRMIEANSAAQGVGQDVPNVELAEVVRVFLRDDMPRFMAYREPIPSEPHTVSNRPFNVDTALTDIEGICANVERMISRGARRNLETRLRERLREST